MKNEIRLALLYLAAAAVPAFAQNAAPQCGTSNYDQARKLFTVINPTSDTINQQCFVTVYPQGTMPSEAQKAATSYLAEGRYIIELSGGGGGGGGGAAKDQGGGGGGAGAAPSRTVQYLAPGVYKLTLGAGGEGGNANGGRTEAGNPTSLTNANTGQLIAGFAGADVWMQRTQAAGDGHGGAATAGGSRGGDGGDAADVGVKSEDAAQAGGASATKGYAGIAGKSGAESGRSAQTDAGRVVLANAGGGGGASVGSGGAGESASKYSTAGVGDLGGGGGGGRGGLDVADAGGQGGHGFIRLTMAEPAPVAVLPPIVRVVQKHSLSSDALFGFGKTKLNSAGEAKLDDLVGKLKDVNIESITDTGHADRIGSSETNQRISEKRADAVKAYLVSKGIDAKRISSLGKGEAEPVTDADACKGAATPKVIACLQADRRVDIEVMGTDKAKTLN